MEKFESLEKQVGEYGREINRIQKSLQKYLPRERAVGVSREIYDIILDVDESIDKLLADPALMKKYDYDGKFFEPKDSPYIS